MKDEKSLVEDEWLQYATDDLESARLLLEKSDNYHISAYHSHQTIEKLFKWFLLKKGKKFPFIHDLKELFRQISEVAKVESLFKDVSYVDDLYPQLRYPTGEQVTQEEAQKSLIIAEKFNKIIRSLAE